MLYAGIIAWLYNRLSLRLFMSTFFTAHACMDLYSLSYESIISAIGDRDQQVQIAWPYLIFIDVLSYCVASSSPISLYDLLPLRYLEGLFSYHIFMFIYICKSVYFLLFLGVYQLAIANRYFTLIQCVVLLIEVILPVLVWGFYK